MFLAQILYRTLEQQRIRSDGIGLPDSACSPIFKSCDKGSDRPLWHHPGIIL